MNSLNHDDLVPRPSPKPSQIEVPVISAGPEVPEASLLFDPSVRRAEPTKVLLPKNTTDQPNYAGNSTIPSHPTPSYWERKASNKHEHSSCRCSLNPESSRMANDVVSSPLRSDFVPSNQHVNFVYESNKNTSGTNNLYSHFMPYPQNCLMDCNPTNVKQPFVTLDEYQKMVSQFTKMILNLNYKFNQVLDNSVSHEELNQITRRFELQIENLTQRVTELNLKLEKANSELASCRVMDYKCCPRNYEPPTRPISEHKCCQLEIRPQFNLEKECNDNLQLLGQSQKSPGVMKTCSRVNNQQYRDPDCRDHRRVNVEDLQRERVSGGRLSIRGGVPVDLICESNDLEHVMANLDLVPQNDAPKQCYSNREFKLSSNNVITPSDMSRLMNTIATKYIPEGQFDMNKQGSGSAQEQEATVQNDCNNVSIATLQYMERYQLLSSTNQNSTKSFGVSKMRSMSNQPPFHHQEMPEGNDRSFLRE